MRKVDKNEFVEFLKNYPNKISHDYCAIVEPPLHSYYDWSLADSSVQKETVDYLLKCRIATYRHDWLDDSHEYHIKGVHEVSNLENEK